MASAKPQSSPSAGQIEKDSSSASQNKEQKANVAETDGWTSRTLELDPSAEYKMTHKRRGLALIFNHEDFYWQLRLGSRRGTNTDSMNLNRILTDLGFDVQNYYNLRTLDILEKIQEASTADHSNADCFLCVFLSHGEDRHIYSYDSLIDIQELTNSFKGDKCESLVGKPKIFIFQACRGEKHDNPVLPTDETDSVTLTNITEVDAASLYTLPAGADFIMCYSVAEGYYSHRETVNGSWYIQDLCEVLKAHAASLEFTEILTLVNRKVSQRSVEFCNDPKAIGKKQIPCFSSMLTKKLFLKPKSN
ncbi:hypothetical protein XENTR_v10000869 [Xenopus tropicalis]|uniref:Caspase-6 n=1 Tax=Xenopus tropicalis TaxID=8364 RepID=F6R1R1_XENTR|nr:hypothetical protein XENTR_v10000869 [Xenopus tropicalis]